MATIGEKSCPPVGRNHVRQWGEPMAATGEKPMAVDTVGGRYGRSPDAVGGVIAARLASTEGALSLRISDVDATVKRLGSSNERFGLMQQPIRRRGEFAAFAPLVRKLPCGSNPRGWSHFKPSRWGHCKPSRRLAEAHLELPRWALSMPFHIAGRGIGLRVDGAAAVGHRGSGEQQG